MQRAANLVFLLVLGFSWNLQGLTVPLEGLDIPQENVDMKERNKKTLEAELGLDQLNGSGTDLFSLNATKVCKEAPERGPCKGFFRNYFFNSSSMSCELFTYGGCGGNQNNFKTERECLQRCHSDVVCHLAPDTGPCEGFSRNYFFNSSSMSCELFTYGGCWGNQNNFKTERECLQRCRTEAVCRLPMSPKPCSGQPPIWAFDSSAGLCVPYKVGFCQANANKFYTKAECEEYCGKAEEDGADFLAAN